MIQANLNIKKSDLTIYEFSLLVWELIRSDKNRDLAAIVLCNLPNVSDEILESYLGEDFAKAKVKTMKKHLWKIYDFTKKQRIKDKYDLSWTEVK